MRGIHWTGWIGLPVVARFRVFLLLEFNPRIGENGGHWKRWISSRRSVTSRDKVDCRSIHDTAQLFSVCIHTRLYTHACIPTSYVPTSYVLRPTPRVSPSRSTSPPSLGFFSFFLFVLFAPLLLFLRSRARRVAQPRTSFHRIPFHGNGWTSSTRNPLDPVPPKACWSMRSLGDLAHSRHSEAPRKSTGFRTRGPLHSSVN